MAKLCLLSPDGVVDKQWEIGEKPLIVGRGETVDVKIDDEGLSRRHFMVFREGAEYLIKDLSSRNGTWLDGQRAMQLNLRHEDRILAGRTQFRFCERDTRVAGAVGPGGTQRPIGPHDTVIISQTE